MKLGAIGPERGRMKENENEIGTYVGIRVSLEWCDGPPADPQAGHQVIIFTIPRALLGTPSWYAMHGLGNALGCGSVRSDAISGGDVRVEIPHTEEVDQRILTLIDLLMTVRYEHPTMVQLSMEVEPAEAAELEAVLS